MVQVSDGHVSHRDDGQLRAQVRRNVQQHRPLVQRLVHQLQLRIAGAENRLQAAES